MGHPEALLTDSGAIFTASSRGGTVALESELLSLGIASNHSRPYHPIVLAPPNTRLRWGAGNR